MKRQTGTEGRRCEDRAMPLTRRGALRQPELREACYRYSSAALRRSPRCRQLGLGPVASRTVRRYISIVEAIQPVGVCYGGPRKLTQLLLKMVNTPLSDCRVDCHAPSHFKSGCPEMSIIHLVSPSTSGPEQRLDSEHLQAASSLLSALMCLPHSVGGDRQREMTAGKSSNWHELVIQGNPCGWRPSPWEGPGTEATHLSGSCGPLWGRTSPSGCQPGASLSIKIMGEKNPLPYPFQETKLLGNQLPMTPWPTGCSSYRQSQNSRNDTDHPMTGKNTHVLS